jgi:N-acetylglutamate synthase-like GNAT family acetyltransferase
MMLLMFSVRVATAADRPNILKLYPHGLNQAAGNGTLRLISQLINAPDSNSNRFWIAELDDRLIGCVILSTADPNVAHLFGLCVESASGARDAILKRLGETAVADAWETGYLKLVIHTDHSPEKLSGTLRQLSFEFSREAWLDGTHVLEFYQDIYHRPDSDGVSGNMIESR